MGALLLKKYWKEIGALALMGIMALSIYILSLRIDILESDLGKAQLKLQVTEDSLVSCTASTKKQNLAILELKNQGELARDEILKAQGEAEAITKQRDEAVKRIKDAPVIKSCDDGMKVLHKSVL